MTGNTSPRYASAALPVSPLPEAGLLAGAVEVGLRIVTFILDKGQDAAFWFVADGYRALAEGGSLLLIVSGLSILAIVVPVMLLQGAVVDSPADQATKRDDALRRRLRAPSHPDALAPIAAADGAVPLDPDDLSAGEDAAADVHPTSHDDVLDALLDAGGGDPWMMDVELGRVVVRLDRCGERHQGAGGCAWTAGFLLRAYQRLYPDADVDVSETSCEAAPGVCTFEVTY